MKYISAMNDIFWNFQLHPDTMAIVRGGQLVYQGSITVLKGLESL